MFAADLRLVDNADVTLGSVISFGFDSAVVVTSEGYIVQLDLVSGHITNTIYATGTGGSGTLYGNGLNLAAQATYVEATDTYYAPAGADATGAPVESPDVDYQSELRTTITDTSGILAFAAELVALSGSEVGLPQNITLPLRFE